MSDSAWFNTMAIYGIAGLALLFFCFSQCRERVVMDKKETENVKVSDLWMEFVHNRPLRILAFFFITAFAMCSVGNAAGAYYMNYNLHGTAAELSIFMGLGSIPAFIFMPLIPAIKKLLGKKGMFYIFLLTAIVGMAMLYAISMIPALKEHMILVYIAQFIKSTGVIVATGYMWALVPEVISYGEYTTGRRISGIVNALTGIFYKAGMALGGVVPGLVLAFVGFNSEAADVVLNVGDFFDKDYEEVVDQLSEMKHSCRDSLMKVIVESGALKTAENVRNACILSLMAGADFLKTSTGKEYPGASLEACYVMCEVIKEYYEKTGRMVGFKAAGGVATTEDAVKYYTIVKEVLGDQWLETNEFFRLGASRLANNVLSDILGEPVKFF